MHCDVIYPVGINSCTRRWLVRWCLSILDPVHCAQCAACCRVACFSSCSLTAGLHVHLPQANACYSKRVNGPCPQLRVLVYWFTGFRPVKAHLSLGNPAQVHCPSRPRPSGYEKRVQSSVFHLFIFYPSVAEMLCSKVRNMAQFTHYYYPNLTNRSVPPS